MPLHKDRPHSSLSARWRHSLPDDIVEDILTDVWLRQDIGDRWQFYRAMLAVCRQWRCVMLLLRFQFVIVEDKRDCNSYRRLFLSFFPQTGVVDPEEDEPYLAAFSRTHIRAPSELLDHLSFVLNCVSIEVIIGSEDSQSLDFSGAPLPAHLSYPWTRFPHLRSLSLLYLPNTYEPRRWFTRSPAPQPRTTPSITHLHLHSSTALTGQHATPLKRLSRSYPNITHLRLSAPIPLFHFSKLWKDLEMIEIDVPPERAYREGHFQHCHIAPFMCVFAIKSGLFPPLQPPEREEEDEPRRHRRMRRLVVNAGVDEPIGWNNLAAVCREYEIELVRKVEYDRPWSKGTGKSAEKMVPKEILRRPSYCATALHCYPDD